MIPTGNKMNRLRRKPPPSIDPKTLKTLTEIFYSDEFGMRNASLLYKEAVKQKLPVSYQQVRKGFYELQELVQMFLPLKKPTPSKVPIRGRYTGERIYFDSMYFPRNKIAILNAFDLYSKFAWGKPIRLKKRADETTESVDSSKAANFLQEVLTDLHKRGFSMDNCISDSGSEFLGTFQKVLEEEGIPQVLTEPGDHLLLGPIDGYTRGLRLAAEKWLTVNPGRDLYKQVPQLIETYNSTFHTTIKMSPEEAMGKVAPLVDSASDDRDPPKLSDGDSVRIAIRLDKNPRKKIRANWSREIYEVEEVNPVTRQVKVSNGRTYRENDLQQVPFPDLVMRYIPPPSADAAPKEPYVRREPEILKREPSMRERKAPAFLADYV